MLSSSVVDNSEFSFCGKKLKLVKSVVHLGYIPSKDLSDNLGISSVKQDMCRKTNHMLSVFRSCDSFTKTKLTKSLFLSLLEVIMLLSYCYFTVCCWCL